MNLLIPGPQSAAYQLRALATVARAAKAGLDRPQRAVLDAIQRVVLALDTDLTDLEDITPEDLASHVGNPAEARQLLRFMVVVAVADGPPSQPQISLLHAYSNAFAVDEPAIDVIGHLARGNLLRFKLAFMRRSHIGHYFRNTYRMAGGVRPLIAALLRFRGIVGEDTETASRFHALKQLPEESLGHRFYDHCVANSLAFPGEVGGFPQGAVYHDFTHVLTDCDTSAEGEMLNAAFQSGYTRDDHDFFTWLFSIILHTTGVNLTPFEFEMVPGRIAEGSLAIDILHALKLGNQAKLDLGDRWDCWEYVELPIDTARERLGVVPLRMGMHA